MQVTIENGIATLPDGTTVSLVEMQAACIYAFQELGGQEFAQAADAVGRLTGLFQGPHGEWIPDIATDESRSYGPRR